MKQAGLVGASRRRFLITTRRGFAVESAPDLVRRQFVADAPDQAVGI